MAVRKWLSGVLRVECFSVVPADMHAVLHTVRFAAIPCTVSVFKVVAGANNAQNSRHYQ